MLLHVENLSVSHRSGGKEIPLTHNVSFTLDKHQCLGIVGESGSGKSITCSAINGLLDNQHFSMTGKAIFHDENLLEMGVEKRRSLRGKKICMILQNPNTAFNPLFTIGEQAWGNSGTGGALGTDKTMIEVRRAYIDWIVPSTALSVRMGLQYFGAPSAAGGTGVLGADVAGISANYKINDMFGLTAAWVRPYNDNYTNSTSTGDSSNFLDNLDLFFLSVPVKGAGWTVTPWIMGGAMGKNAHSLKQNDVEGRFRFATRVGLFGGHNNESTYAVSHAPAYTSMIWAGIPITFAYASWNVEFDFNYGSVGYSGTYSAEDRAGNVKRIDRQRAGWLAKALVEYKMDWGTPGIFAWYGSGDDSNVSDGSERMPVLGPSGTFTSFFGDDPWSYTDSSWTNNGFDQMLGYDGTWGIGLQVKNMSFMEDLSHVFRVAYWGGTNHTENAKYLGKHEALGLGGGAGTFYLTTADYMVEFNLDSTYKIYDNLTATLQLGYAINGIDKDTWGYDERRDGYKAGLIMRYAF